MKVLLEKLRPLKQIMKVLSRFLKKNQAQREKKCPEQPDTADIPDLEKEESAAQRRNQ